MKIGNAALFQYRLPLARPLPGRASHVAFREGLVVRITGRQDTVGWGEIAPLPGYSAETLEEARDAAVRYLGALNHVDLPESGELLKSGISSFSDKALPPSVACGVESAVLNLWAAVQGIELRHHLNPSASNFVTVNGLLAGSENEVMEQAHRLVDSGYSSLKLKVGVGSIDEEIARVRALRRLAPDCAIRLDANRAWDFETAAQFGNEVKECEIEYIEEPLADPSLLDECFRQSGLAYALDESLQSVSPATLANRNGLRAVVLKPTLLGGPSIALQFAEHARQLGIQPVISSSFESSLGLWTLANLASAVAPEIACGLDTAKWLAEDLLDHSPVGSDGTIALVDFAAARQSVQTDRLTEIPVSQ